MRTKNIFFIIAILGLALTGCKEDFVSSLLTNDDDIEAGEEVLFTTHVPSRTTRMSAAQEAFNERMEAYKAVNALYHITVQMYEKDVAAPLGTAAYRPDTTMNGATVSYPDDGTLKATTSSPLYWPNTHQQYGFKATAGTSTLATDQSSEAKLIAQDLLEGYGFEPLYDTSIANPDAPTAEQTEVGGTDNETGLNYRTPRQWYDANVATRGLAPGGVDAATWYKKIPLYLQHQRSLITIKLKAGEGVDRNSLLFQNAKEYVKTTIFNYVGSDTLKIQPFAKKTYIDYEGNADPTDDVETTEYSAVVYPHNYLSGATTKPIARINLSAMNFTFYASNDFKYDASTKLDATDHDAAVTHMTNYNLLAGQHLVITATLGRGSRKVVISAYVEDWDETITSSVVDDYGQAGDPIQINSRQQLYDFLRGPKNKPGNVAIIVPNSLNLEKSGSTDLAWDYAFTKPDSVRLNCTLNLAGATLRTDHQIFSTIHSLGNVVNGTITVGTKANTSTTVPAAIAENNLGTIQHIDVVPKDANGNASNSKASVAGLVQNNSGSILDCTSSLPVSGTSGTVGGIAAVQHYDAENGNVMPVIDGCTVTVRVDGITRTEGVQTPITVGGGIVGRAVGRVTNNTFTYGRTLLQHPTDFKNIIYAKYTDGDHDLRAYGNAWPTSASDYSSSDTPNTNVWTGTIYDHVIDRQAELAELLDKESYNRNGTYYRLSADFALTGWSKRILNDNVGNDSGGSNVKFNLDGNNMTITTDGMLFNNIKNSVHDLTIRLSADLIATSLTNPNDTTSRTGGNAMAPLAFSVNGPTAVIRNIQVKGAGYRIQARNVGGVVVWAYGGATVENCQSKANLQIWDNNPGSQAKIYGGGIVAAAARATITRCVFHSTSGTLFRNTSSDYRTTTGTGDAHTGFFYGGILGGTATYGEVTREDPQVLLTDCTSWFTTAANSTQKGAIIGYAEYADVNDKTHNGLANGGQGNWWPEGSDAIGTFNDDDGMTVEKLLGKKNAVKPTANEQYDN